MDENNGELNGLISELTQGKDLVQQLQLHLNAPYSSTCPETTREILLHNIQSKFDKALSLLQYTGSDSSNSLAHFNSAPIPNSRMSDSPPSFTASTPPSEDSDRDLEPKDSAARKRNSSTPRWTKHVQVLPGAAIEGTLDDGFTWRKYGQKDILGARYPRGYYRCTLRHVQGCFATKQVQRSDEDPTIFEVTYRGKHTCNQGGATTNNVNVPAPVTILQSQEPNSGYENQQLISMPHHSQQEILLNFQRDLNISKNDHINFSNPTPNNVPFASFASSSNIKDDQGYNFAPNSMISSSNFVENSSPNNFMSSYFPSQTNDFGGNQDGSHDYQFNSMGFESNFPFDY